MSKDALQNNKEIGFVNNIDSCQVVCSTKKLNNINSNKSDTKKSKLISADEIAASYNSKKDNPNMRELNSAIKPYITAHKHGSKKKVLSQLSNNLSKDNKNIDKILRMNKLSNNNLSKDTTK